MRHHTHLPAALALGLALAAAGALAAQKPKTTVQVQPRDDGTRGARVIALQVWAENLTAGTEARFGIAPTNEAIPVALGDRVRLRLVGTAIEADGDGVEVPIEARFSEAPGTHRLDILERGSNWVVVRVGDRDTGRNDGRAQLAFEVTGRYDLRPAMNEGRVTFELGTRGGGAPVVVPGPVDDRERLRRAEDLATRLYEGILRVDPQAARLASGFDEAVDRIYRFGYDGVIQIARELAREAERRAVPRGSSATAYVGHLYRVLLGRSGSDGDLLASDAGFSSNVRLFERDGAEAVVDVIVRSREFADAHDLHEFRVLRR